MAMPQSLDAMHRNHKNDFDIKKTNRFQVGLNDIHFLDGFNSRDYSRPETQAHIRALADAYKAGDFVPSIIVKVIDGKIYVLEGHCRTLGMRLAVEEGAELGLVNVDQFAGSELEADALVLTSNQTLALTALERAQKYQHMSNRGASASDIAQMIKKTPQHVADYLAMHAMPDSIKVLINDGTVSPTEALAQFREHGSSAVDQIKLAQEASGKNRVTKRDIAKAAGSKPASKRINKKVVTAMVGQFRTLGERVMTAERHEDGSATLKLSAEEIEAILAMRTQLPEQPSTDHGEETNSGD